MQSSRPSSGTLGFHAEGESNQSSQVIAANATSSNDEKPGGTPRLLADFKAATGLGLRLMSVDSASPLWACENPFCRLLRVTGLSGTPCPGMRLKALRSGGASEMTRRCAAGLEHSIIPLSSPPGMHAWIECGQVFLSPPRPRDFEDLRARLLARGMTLPVCELERAFYATPVLNRARLDAGIGLLRGIIAQFELLAESKAAPRLMLEADPIKEVCHFIEQHLGSSIRMADLATKFRLNPAYLCRLFKRRTGQTLGGFIRHARVERAKELLSTGDARVVDIAFAAGFQSLRQFNHVFKAHTQVTPREFRGEPT